MAADGVRRRGHEQRVAVTQRARHRARPDRRTRAGAVLDDDRLLPRLRQFLGHGPRHHVGGPACRIRHHHRDGLDGIRIGLNRSGQQRGGTGHGAQPIALHRNVSSFLW
ncbi:hypothetical protein D9M68_884980 [compost metagenome]